MADENKMPEVGDEAPDFQGMTQDGETVRLSDVRGRRVAIYFYPKDDTSGCTKQACSLRDGWDQLKTENIEVIGISPDDVNSHKKFAGKYSLPFKLVADPEKEIVQKYGVWGQKSMYGRKYMGVNRVTFLIDEQGVVRDVIKKPAVSEHAGEILERWKEIA